MDYIKKLCFWGLGSHHPAVLIPEFCSSFYLEPRNGCDRTIVFVHGFSGDAESTWQYFHSLMISDSFFEKTRIIFYDYDSLNTYLDRSVDTFLKFIRFTNTLSIHDDSDHRITMIGHSLGGLIIRKAVILAHKNNEHWLDASTFALVAPAQAGAHVTKVVDEIRLSFRFLRLFTLTAIKNIVILRDLEETSPGILSLAEEVYKYDDQRIKPKSIIVPENETVVLERKLHGDPEYTVIKGRNHGNVTKVKSQQCDFYKELVLNA